jgi:exosome complex component RRP41
VHLPSFIFMPRFVVNLLGRREDGRALTEVRSPFLSFGCNAAASGSCEFRLGQTIVLASVFGPREPTATSETHVDKAAVRVTVAIAPYATPNRRRSERDSDTTFTGDIVRDCISEVLVLTEYPKSEIVIDIRVLQHCGSYEAVAVTAASFACLDAGLPMTDLPLALSVGFLPSDPGLEDDRNAVKAVPAVDLSDSEAHFSLSMGTVVCLTQSRSVLSLRFASGRLRPQDCMTLVELAIDSAVGLRETLRPFVTLA